MAKIPLRWVGDSWSGLYRLGTLTLEQVEGVDHHCRGELELNDRFEGEPELGGLWEWAPWPTHCDRCGRAFGPDAFRSAWAEEMLRIDGELVRTHDLPVGSVYDAKYPRLGPDGMAVHIILPGPHDWSPDWRANNCGAKDDDDAYCWKREGDPRHPETLHVGPQCDRNCGVGAGSIATGNWHGYVDHGFVTEQRR